MLIVAGTRPFGRQLRERRPILQPGSPRANAAAETTWGKTPRHCCSPGLVSHLLNCLARLGDVTAINFLFFCIGDLIELTRADKKITCSCVYIKQDHSMFSSQPREFWGFLGHPLSPSSPRGRRLQLAWASPNSVLPPWCPWPWQHWEVARGAEPPCATPQSTSPAARLH